jgi:spore maturation protein CgeB
MRTFEVPAVGGASMLTEDTPEHRQIFGPEGEAVLYFNTLAEMVTKTHWLVAHDQERQRLAANAHRLVTRGGHSYQDRLKTMLTYYRV